MRPRPRQERGAAARPRPLGAVATWSVFAASGAVLWAATRPGIAALVRRGARPDVAWFVSGGFVFLGLLLTAAAALRRDGFTTLRSALEERCRFRRMGPRGWRWAVGATLAVLALTGLLQALLRRVDGFTPQPPFLRMGALGPGERWVLLAWLPMFFLNILGEELLWHGYLLPRNEARFGPRAWVVNAVGWWAFHFSFGPWLAVLLLPIILVETWAVQRSGNTWVGIVVHAAVNGPAFVAIALGVL